MAHRIGLCASLPRDIEAARHRMGRPPGRRATLRALDTELDKLQRIPLLIVDEVGYIPFDPQAANLMFMLVARRYGARA